MSDDDSERVSLKFWIAALAFSSLLMASTFALLAIYLAEIKDNTSAALVRSDMVSQRLNNLDVEMSIVQKHVMADHATGVVPPAAVPAPVPEQIQIPVNGNETAPAAPAPQAATPASGQPVPLVAPQPAPALPQIQSPTLETGTPPASQPAQPK